MRKPRVVVLVKYFYPLSRPSGASNFAYELCGTLAQRFDVHVISARSSKEEKDSFSHNGYQVYKLTGFYPISAAFLARRLRPSVVLCLSSIVHSTLFSFWWGLNRVFLRRRKVIFYQLTNIGELKPRSLCRILMNSYNAVVGASPAIVKRLSELCNKTVRYIPSAVSTARLSQVKAVPKGEFRIGFFGHLIWSKGVDILLDAFGELEKVGHSNIELFIAGGWGRSWGRKKTGLQYGKEVMERAKNNERITVMGYNPNVLPYIKSCDVVVLPYRSSTGVLGISQSALEAMFFEIPVVGSKTEALLPLIEDGKDGFIFTSSKDLKSKLEILISDKDLVRKMGKNARRKIEKEYDVSIFEERLALIIQEAYFG